MGGEGRGGKRRGGERRGGYDLECFSPYMLMKPCIQMGNNFCVAFMIGDLHPRGARSLKLM